jgi:hypothetical protein
LLAGGDALAGTNQFLDMIDGVRAQCTEFHRFACSW